MTNKLKSESGLPPILPEGAEILILGSMPGVESLVKQQYYAHPRNAFWRIIAALFAEPLEDDYALRQQILIANGVALWDVIQSCQRIGSLDSAIDNTSIVINDFVGLFTRYKTLKRIYFNGATAEKVYQRHVTVSLIDKFPDLVYLRLPSTSPANAALSFQQKLEAWRIITNNTNL